jgi:hypothetical protein
MGKGSRRGRGIGEEGGFALVELLVATALLAGILIALLNVLDTAARAVPRDVEWTHAVREGRVGVARMVRELRQADAIHGTTPNQLDFEITRGGQARRVMYACDVAEPGTDRRRCTRVEAASGAALPDPASGAPVVLRLLNGTPEDPVFTYGPNEVAPRYVTAQVRIPSTGERRPGASGAAAGHDVVLSDGAFLRNRAGSG